MGTSRILLLGAGFSHNWGGPLASEVVGHLLRQFGQDPYLNSLLTGRAKNFEDALALLQQELLSNPSSNDAQTRLDRVQGAIVEMFGNLNRTFENRQTLEFANTIRLSVTGFLARFDAIFTLNQDLLLELLYQEAMPFAQTRRWPGLTIPGIQPVPSPGLFGIGDKHQRQWQPSAPPFNEDAQSQPLFKLHGSSNWYVQGGTRLLVMGANKDIAIRHSEVLRWYFERFKFYLSSGCRLMVIGYGFGDKHINDAILDASGKGSLEGIFLVDPIGWDVLNPTRHLPVKMHSDLQQVSCLGISTRLLKNTFAGDEFELQNMEQFFNS